jgi:mono/diheme cytochrome c family protein/ketosteroid isomerase-like protein
MKRFKRTLIAIAALIAIGVIGTSVFVYSGAYNIGADDPHTRPMFALMQTLRQRSIHVRSQDIALPNLNDETLILEGGGQYAAMCTGCHLSPGMPDSEIRPGLYPQPPNLSQVRVDPRDAFWVIKHGIKMSAMPAWGMSHDDATIWSMVAFLQKLPDMTPAQYRDLVAKAPPDDEMGEETGHHHHHRSGGTEGIGHGHPQSSAPADEAGHDHSHSTTVASDDHERAATAETPLSFDGFKLKAASAAEVVAESFHRALQRGDGDAAVALLAPEVTIREGGQTQSRDEYAGGHLGEDIAFLKNAQLTPVSLASMQMGEISMVGTETLVTILRKGKPTTLRSRELLTLKRQGAGWTIVDVQWQSQPIENKRDDTNE